MILDDVSSIHDITLPLKNGIPVWPGDPEFLSSWAMLKRDGALSNVSAFSMGTHTGTHIDAPLHLDDAGNDVGRINFRNLIGPVRVFSIATAGCIRSAELEKLNWDGVQRVLFKTLRDSPSENSFRSSYIYLDREAAEFLVKRRVLLVGIDGPSVDGYTSTSLPSHRILLNNGIVILEGAVLTAVPPGDYELICLPLKLAGLDGAPVRAVLLQR